MKSYKDYKFKSVFASKISKISNSELNKYVSMAGLERLKPLMPKNIDLNENPDLIGAVLNCAVGNLNNANGDSITNKSAVKIGKNFVYKLVDILHKRSHIIGTICNYGFSDFITNTILTEEEVLQSKEPVNISLAILLYKVALSDKFIELLEESVDESSPNYQIISASWEMMFSDYDIAVGSKNISDSKIITDNEEKKKYEKYLLANSGTGKNENGELIYRVISDDFLIPCGIGLVQNAAAEVRGLYIIDENKNKLEEITKKTDSNSSETPKSQTITSHSENLAVINNDIINQNTKNKEKPISMTKITKIQDLTDDTIKECKADAIRDFIDEEITKASDKWSKERAEKDNALAEVQKKQSEAVANAEKAQKDLEIVQKQLSEIQNKVIAQEKQEKFNGWMASFDEKYELDKEDKEILASDLNSIDSDESFAKYQKKMDVLLKSKNKEILATKRAEAEAKEKETQSNKEKKTQESTASTKETSGEKIESALENGEKGDNLPNGTTVITSLKDLYKEAFSYENMTQTNKK